MMRALIVFALLAAGSAKADTRALFDELKVLPVIEDRLMARLSRAETFRLLVGICGPARSEPYVIAALAAGSQEIAEPWDSAIETALAEIPADTIAEIEALESGQEQAARAFSALANGPGQAISRAILPLLSKGAATASADLAAIDLETCEPR